MIPFSIDWYEILDSTNTFAIRQIREALAKDPDDLYDLRYKVIICDKQTRGRGLSGHQWISPPGNLYFSVLMPFDFIQHLNRFGQFAIAAGVAITKTIQRACDNANVHVKWPNDVLIDDQKIAGILTEIEKPYIIIGVGINYEIAPYINISTTCIRDNSSSFIKKDILIQWILDALSETFELLREQGFRKIQGMWHEMCWEIGQQITVRGITGEFVRLGEEGEMLLDCDNKIEKIVSFE